MNDNDGGRAFGRSFGRSFGTDLICQSGQAVERDEASSLTIAAGVRGRRA